MEVVMFGLMAMVTVGIIAGVMIYRQAQMDRWAATAAERGLQFDRGGFLQKPRMWGEVRGLHVEATTVSRSQGKSSATYTVVRCDIPTDMPRGFRINREGFETAIFKAFGAQDITIPNKTLDSRLRVRGKDEDAIRALFVEPELEDAFLRFLAIGQYSRVESGAVICDHRGIAPDRLEEMIDTAQGLAASLARARLGPWHRFADQYGLTFREQGGRFELDGEFRGLPLSVRAGTSGGSQRSVFRVRIPRTMPAGFRITAGDGGIALGDPVLDPYLRIDGDDPDAVERLFGNADMDEMRGDLLSVLHAFPRSRVEDGEVVLITDGVPVDRLEELANEAVRLAQALGAAAGEKRRDNREPTRAARAAARFKQR